MFYLHSFELKMLQKVSINSLSRYDLDKTWEKVRSEHSSGDDDMQKAKNRRKDWLDWYAKSKSEKETY